MPSRYGIHHLIMKFLNSYPKETVIKGLFMEWTKTTCEDVLNALQLATTQEIGIQCEIMNMLICIDT